MDKPNLEYIKSMSGGDIGFEQKLINIIKTEFPVERQTYFDCIADKNFKDTAAIVHKIKHKISILGLEKSYEVAAAYELKLLNEETDLKNDFELILATITGYLQKI